MAKPPHPQSLSHEGRGRPVFAPLACLAVSLLALVAATPALAAEPPPSTPSLLEAMVASGVITQGQADKILADARARDAAKAATAQAASAAPPAADGAVHVQYVPEVVKKQLRDEIKSQVMAQAKDEGWAAPNQIPEWTQRVTVSGDIRVRSEEDIFPKGNTLGTADQINFASLNTRSTPIDVANLANFGTGSGASGSNAVPYYNWNQDRERERLRGRVAVDADLGEGFATGFRLATGESSSPVSTNQSLGGSGGNFSKYQLWLDKAFIKYELPADTGLGVTATVGRFANPFFSTDLIWNNDLNFDGFAANGRYRLARGVTPFVTIGAFPVYNTALDFSTYDTTKTSSQDRWLYALQAGTDWQAAKETAVKAGLAYYHFDNIGGRQTSCVYDNITCGSDVFRPTFAQHGNSYMDLRQNTGRTASTDVNYQYFGLASGFQELALTGRLDYDGMKPIFSGQDLRLSVEGEYVKNLGFDKGRIQRMYNAGSLENNVVNSSFVGGDTGAMLRTTVGTPKLAQRWDWNVSLAYKYIESDAVVDAFNDSDFGMGGTNLKGYVLGGNLALARNVWTSLRWMSADQVNGAPYSSDVIFLDINAKF